MPRMYENKSKSKKNGKNGLKKYGNGGSLIKNMRMKAAGKKRTSIYPLSKTRQTQMSKVGK